MRKFITEFPGNEVLNDFTTDINAASAVFTPFKINLSPDEKSGSRTMSQGREGYVRLVSRVANQFPDAFRRADVPTELEALLEYYDNLESNRLAITQALEIIDDIKVGAGIDIMTLVDRYVQNLQVSRTTEASLDFAMEEVDEYNRRFDKTKGQPQD